MCDGNKSPLLLQEIIGAIPVSCKKINQDNRNSSSMMTSACSPILLTYNCVVCGNLTAHFTDYHADNDGSSSMQPRENKPLCPIQPSLTNCIYVVSDLLSDIRMIRIVGSLIVGGRALGAQVMIVVYAKSPAKRARDEDARASSPTVTGC
jgi:hypothetical protein